MQLGGLRPRGRRCGVFRRVVLWRELLVAQACAPRPVSHGKWYIWLAEISGGGLLRKQHLKSIHRGVLWGLLHTPCDSQPCSTCRYPDKKEEDLEGASVRAVKVGSQKPAVRCWGEGRERPRGPLSGLCRPLPSSPTGRPEASRVSGIPKPEPP